jgi:hypothetical protein
VVCIGPPTSESGLVNDDLSRSDPTIAASCLQLAVNSAVAESVLEMIKDRFDHVTSQVTPGAGTVVTVTGIDQSGQRALLNLLWDTGHEIRSMSSS